MALEGAEGCGKSTQAARLADALGAVLTRETGGTAVGARLREILHDTTVVDLADRAEALITAADRAQHVHTVVRPALAAGRRVVSDRSVHSTLAYQGHGRGLDVDELRRINDWAIDGLWPELVILLDAPSDVLAARISGRELDRFERAGDDFHARVAAGFRAMAAADPARWVVVDADGDVESVADRVRAALDGWSAAVSSVWDDVVGQPAAVARLTAAAAAPVHAYLLRRTLRFDEAHRRPRRSPPCCSPAPTTPDRRDARLALAGAHPDVHEVERSRPGDLGGPGP